MESAVHMGQAIRSIRLIKQIKQETFARGMGIRQQNVSKMEKRKEISTDKLELAAKVLGVTVETIKDFDEKVLFNNNIALEQNSGQQIFPVKDIIEYFKGEMEKKDKIIENQRRELEAYRHGKKKPVKAAKKKSAKGLRRAS